MYKDKEKSNEAAKERMRRYRDKAKGVTESGRNKEGVTEIPTDEVCVTPGPAQNVIPKKQGITYFEDLPANVQRTIESMASSPEDKQARAEIAIRYHRMFPSPRWSV